MKCKKQMQEKKKKNTNFEISLIGLSSNTDIWIVKCNYIKDLKFAFFSFGGSRGLTQ